MFAIIPAMPMLAKILLSLGLILAANRYCRHLAASVLVGTLSLALLTGHTPASGARITVDRLISLDNFYLMLVIFLVIWLSTQMAGAGIMRDLVAAIRGRLGRRHAMAILPAVIGFLPMPGGAIFSAPLVDGCDASGQTAPILKARANYWFRHVWEYWWPLYPGVLLAMHITGLEVWQFMLLGLPLSCAAIAGGYIFLLRKIPLETPDDSMAASGPSVPKLLLPIFVVIAGYLLARMVHAGARAALPRLPELNRYLPMIFGILLAMLTVEVRRPLPRHAWRAIFFSRSTLSMALIVAAVRVYGAFIEAPLPGGATTPITIMQAEMAYWGIPMFAMVMLLPFIAGVTSGLAVGFVGASFPIITSLMGAHPPVNLVLACTVLAYACGHIGQMLSPVHVCLVVTNEHFKTNLFHSLRGLLPPTALVVGVAMAMAYLLAKGV